MIRVELQYLGGNNSSIIDQWFIPKWEGDDDNWITVDLLLSKHDLQRVGSTQVQQVDATHVIKVDHPLCPKSIYLKCTDIIPKIVSKTDHKNRYTIFKRDFLYKGTDRQKGWKFVGESFAKSYKSAIRKFLKDRYYFNLENPILVRLVRYRNIKHNDYLVGHQDQNNGYKELIYSDITNIN